MFERIKKMLSGSGPEKPKGVTMVDDGIREIAGILAIQVELQVTMGGLDEDRANWVRDERATVLGYIDGHAYRYYIGIGAAEKSELASLLAAEQVMKGARTTDQLFQELWNLRDAQDPVFDKARRAGWSDLEGSLGPEKRHPLALAGILLGKL
jgi:hypothetical protein